MNKKINSTIKDNVVSDTPKKRGRPKKVVVPQEEIKKKRGRPKKVIKGIVPDVKQKGEIPQKNMDDIPAPEKKKRGRPKKTTASQEIIKKEKKHKPNQSDVDGQLSLEAMIDSVDKTPHKTNALNQKKEMPREAKKQSKPVIGISQVDNKVYSDKKSYHEIHIGRQIVYSYDLLPISVVRFYSIVCVEIISGYCPGDRDYIKRQMQKGEFCELTMGNGKKITLK